MIIKCPKCSTGYNIPDKVLNNKPRKMKCSNCKNIFTVTKRTSHPPQGYVEFTGSQQLPSQFAFLEAEKGQADGLNSVNNYAKETSDGVVQSQSVLQKNENPKQNLGTDSSETNQVQANLNTLNKGGATPIGNSMPAQSLFGTNSMAWEVEKPLELANFSIGNEVTHGTQMAGKVAFFIGLIVVSFFSFVFVRNDFSLSLSSFTDQVLFAFSFEEVEKIPELAKGIEALAYTRNMVIGSDKQPRLIVQGEVFNNNPATRTQIVLRGRLRGPDKKVYSEIKLPCGRVLDERAIIRMEKGSVIDHFSQGGKIYNCQLATNTSTSFQLIFDDVPEEYSAAFTVDIQVISADR